MESFVAKVSGKLSVASSGTVGEKLNPEGLITSISGTFELFGFKATEFSQQNLFCGIVSPMTSLDSVFDNASEGNFSTETNAHAKCEPNLSHHFITDLLRQIAEKKKRLMFLQKRFG